MPSSKAYFYFPDINISDEFSFEKLTTDNFQQLYFLFDGDDSPFTDKRFKQYASAEKYANELDKHGRFFPKHGSQDWLFKWIDEYAGILHLYDLSLESFAENNKRCWIGFATKLSLRKRNYKKSSFSFHKLYFPGFP